SPSQGPTDEQYNSLVALVKDIKTRHTINYVVRHSDIAPGRKTDPWRFDWKGFNQRLREE
ncbi:MAG: N-acetylmuramoyl-L-alanine amidase, partial [Paludibacteraceae bacterium]|nr:N-acetylmuramoyl-L-alanine amidase [Paludibacteraceae bacterium]